MDLLDVALMLPRESLLLFELIDARLLSCRSGVAGTIWDGWTDPDASAGSGVGDADKVSGTDVI